MTRVSLISVAFTAALLTLGPIGVEESAAQGCLSQSQVRAAVANGQVAPLSNFVGGLRSMGDVVSSRLCESGGRLAYIVEIVKSNGQVTQAVLDARSGRRLE